MTAIPPHLRKALDDGRARIVDQPARTAKARPSRATPPAEGLWLCDQCGQVFPSDRQAEKHVNDAHHGGRYSTILEARP